MEQELLGVLLFDNVFRFGGESLGCFQGTECCSGVVNMWKQDPRPPLPEHVSDTITDFLLKCFQKV